GGAVTPDQYVVKIGNDEASGTVLERDIAEKTTARIATPTGLMDQPLSEEDRKRPVLEEQDILSLAHLVKDVERTMVTPVDSEWAFRRADFPRAALHQCHALPIIHEATGW